jgi:hypothetical protein
MLFAEFFPPRWVGANVPAAEARTAGLAGLNVQAQFFASGSISLQGHEAVQVPAAEPDIIRRWRYKVTSCYSLYPGSVGVGFQKGVLPGS